MVFVCGFPVMLVVHNPIYLANYPVDMRKSINGLMILVKTEFDRNPCDGAYYIFCNRMRDKLKVLYWDGDGFCLWYKSLEKSRFKLHYRDDQRLTMSVDQFNWLLSGVDWRKLSGRSSRQYNIFV